MKRRHHSPEQIIRKLREAERMLGEGKQIPEVAKELGISEATFHRWRNQYGGMKADEVRRLKELERENAQLKAIVGLKLWIEELRGKRKLNQNRAPEDRQGVRDALAASTDPGDQAVSRSMRALDEKEQPGG